MSHGKERKEKNCLNCGAQVQGRYCHICGQENIETHETMWGLITHFVYDITHFDGKFFSTLRYLLFRPGFLSMEYLRGRRASYLHPIKMYVFTSALFFFILFAVRREEDMLKGVDWDVQEKRAALLQRMAAETDTVVWLKMQDSLRTIDTTLVFMEASKLIERHPSLPDSVRNGILAAMQQDEKHSINISFLGGDLPHSEMAYDSLQASLPAGQRDGWLRQYITRKTYQLNAKFRYQQGEIFGKVAGKFIHSLPQMMFISLPLVAGFISLLYIRQRRSNYVSHGILTVHNYIAMYIFILLFLGCSYLRDLSGWGIFGFLMLLLALYMFYYNYRSLRNFFGQGRGITILKFSLLNLLVLILFAFLSTIFVINSLLSV